MNADFDFLLGHWRVKNRRLQKRLQGNDGWDAFSAASHNQRLPAGIGNYDDFIADSWRKGFVGMSLRIYNPETALWSIYWLDNATGGVHPSGLLRNPVVGKFSDKIGLLEGEEDVEGRPVLVRYRWSDIAPNSARWEQFMSADGASSWEMNWEMLFERCDPA